VSPRRRRFDAGEQLPLNIGTKATGGLRTWQLGSLAVRHHPAPPSRLPTPIDRTQKKGAVPKHRPLILSCLLGSEVELHTGAEVTADELAVLPGRIELVEAVSGIGIVRGLLVNDVEHVTIKREAITDPDFSMTV
jgi:hypothetical protein